MNTLLSAARALLGLGLALSTGIAAAQAVTAAPEPHHALDPLIKDVCGKQLLLLGEDANHGSGATLALKVELVKRLIEECHYSAVVFESQVYDFIDLQHALEQKTATPDQVTASIGGLWSKARETAPLVDYLFHQASVGRVTLAGIDPQIGGATQRYTQQRLPEVLASHLDGKRGAACEAELTRLTNWQYDDTAQYDDATRARLRKCLTDIRAAAVKHDATRETLEVEHMASNLVRYLDMANGNDFNVRDHAMFDNLRWQLARMPKDTKVIVWCASVHAAKAAMPGSDDIPMGRYIHDTYKEHAAAVGFSALSGSFGRPGKTPSVLATAAPKSLEGRVLAIDGNFDEIHYVDYPTLARFGTITARALNYQQPQAADWARLLDGLVVLREEQPQH